MSTPNRRQLRTAGLVLLGVAAIAVVFGLVDFADGGGGRKTSASAPPPSTSAPSSASAPPSTIPYPPPVAESPAPGVPDGGGPAVAGPLGSGPLEPGAGVGPGPEAVAGTDAAAGVPASATGNSRGEVRVYNNSTIRGLAARAAGDLTAAGWTVIEVGNYAGGTIPTTTAYYQDGTDQRDGAEAIGADFRMRVAPRFPGIANAGPGLIVIVTNDYASS